MIALLFASIISTTSPSSHLLESKNSGIPYFQCFKEASKAYKVELPLLLAIAEKESNFNSRAFNSKNGDGSFDIGIMQVNSSWLKKHRIKKEVMFEPCVNIQWGAYIMADAIYTYGYSWRGVGKYNAKSELKGFLYASDVSARYDRFYRCLKINPSPSLAECD